MNLRIYLYTKIPNKFAAIDLRLRNGIVVENLAIDATGAILGKVVGGQDGIDESPLSFKQEDIEAYRLRLGFLAHFGLAKWQPVNQLGQAEKR